jgi:hypothetical protein
MIDPLTISFGAIVGIFVVALIFDGETTPLHPSKIKRPHPFRARYQEHKFGRKL